jgi:phosphotriesterase-related protein
MTPIIRTVLGDIPAQKLGVTMSHEHLLVDLIRPNFTSPDDTADAALAEAPVTRENFDWVRENWTNSRDNLVLDSEELAAEEVSRYRMAGGMSLVDVTSVGIGRDPMALARIAETTGLNILMGCGYYVGATHPSSLANLSEEDIAADLIGDVRVGAQGTDVRAGVIGEIGCSWPMEAGEVKVLRGAALAQRELRCALSIHPGKHRDAPFAVVDHVQEVGGELDKAIICHIERTLSDISEIEALADMGCYVEYDIFGVESAGAYYKKLGITIPSDRDRVAQISRLMHDGYGDNVLVSLDVCSKHRLRKYGGHGYDHILTSVVPLMREHGLSEVEINHLLVENPRRAFATVV